MFVSGSIRWCSKLYRNQGNLLFRPPPLDWSEQVVILTGGASGIGELLANTLAVRSVTVVVLDVKPIVTENCWSIFYCHLLALTFPKDNIAYYKCDVSKWDEVAEVSKRITEEVN